MPEEKSSSKSWFKQALKRVARFSHRLREELKAGEAEVLRSEKEFDYDAPDAAAAKDKPEWWDILQVSPTATKDEIQSAYRRLIKMNHPDKATQLSPEVQATMERDTKLLNDAYERAMKILNVSK